MATTPNTLTLKDGTEVIIDFMEAEESMEEKVLTLMRRKAAIMDAEEEYEEKSTWPVLHPGLVPFKKRFTRFNIPASVIADLPRHIAQGLGSSIERGWPLPIGMEVFDVQQFGYDGRQLVFTWNPEDQVHRDFITAMYVIQGGNGALL